MRMVSAAILALVFAATPADKCRADFQSHNSDPYLRYLSLEAVPKKQLATWSAVMAFQIPSASREELLDHQLPQQIPGTNSFRIDLRALGWSPTDFAKVVEKYPYSDKPNPLIVNGPWLVNQLADSRDSDALYRLLYGGKNIPKTTADFLKFWKVAADQQRGQTFGWVETASQVAKQSSRHVTRENAGGNSVWITKDVAHVTRGSDPLEALDGNFKFDASELIVQFAKTSLYQRSRGAAQAYLLSDGKGKVVQEAPVRIVQDYTQVLGQPAITTSASCISCHTKGLLSPTENGLEAALKSGIQLKAYSYGKQQEAESFHLTDSAKQLARDCEDYETFVKACNGLTGDENAEAYRQALAQYRADLSLEDCAREQYVPAEELKLALAYASANYIDLGPRLSGIVHGRKISRDGWEADYVRTQAALTVWRSVK